MSKSCSRRFCRQCGNPLPIDADPHTYLCGTCSQLNAKLKNRQNNKEWYAKNKEKRKAAYRLKHPKKTKVIPVEDPIQYPSPEKIRENVDRLIRQAEDKKRYLRYSNRHLHHSLVTTKESSPSTIHSALISGREYIVETRGNVCGECHTYSDKWFRI